MPHPRRTQVRHPNTDLARLWLETGTVMALRMAMLAGDVAPAREAGRMFDEKQPALVRAASDAAMAAVEAMFRHPCDPWSVSCAATDAWVRSVTRKVRGNRRRLVKHGRAR